MIKDFLSILYQYLTDLEAKKDEICPQHNQKCKASVLEYVIYELDSHCLYPRKTLKTVLNTTPAFRLLNIDFNPRAPSCGKPVQDRLKKEMENAKLRHERVLWQKINYVERPDNRPKHEKNRITNITGKWIKNDPNEYDTTGYDSDRGCFTGNTDDYNDTY